MLTITEITKELEITEKDPVDRVAKILKVGMKYFTQLKEGFFSEDSDTKSETKQLIAFIVKHLESEIQKAQRELNIPLHEFLGKIYRENKLTPEECQMYLEAQALIAQYQQEIFLPSNNKEEKTIKNKAKVIRKRKPLVRIGV